MQIAAFFSLFCSFSAVFSSIATALDTFVCAVDSDLWEFEAENPIEKIENSTEKKELEATALLFQKWLFARQNLCYDETDKLRLVHGQPCLAAGVTMSVYGAVNNLLMAIEINKIYRPHSLQFQHVSPFLWADRNPKECTMERQSIDCYFEPVSICDGTETYIQDYWGKYNVTRDMLQHDIDYAGMFSGLDACAVTRLAGRGLIWMYGHLSSFVMRMRKDISDDVNSRVTNVIPQVEANIRTIAVHIRGGSPDKNRKTAPISTYMKHVDEAIERFKLEGVDSIVVFLCSDSPDYTYRSADWMQLEYPRDKVEYRTLTYTKLHETGKEETEHILNRLGDKSNFHRQLFVEIMADIEILIQSDLVIGSFSNIFFTVSSQRLIRGKYQNTSCMLFIRSDDPPLLCDGSESMRPLWRQFFVEKLYIL